MKWQVKYSIEFQVVLLCVFNLLFVGYFYFLPEGLQNKSMYPDDPSLPRYFLSVLILIVTCFIGKFSREATFLNEVASLYLYLVITPSLVLFCARSVPMQYLFVVLLAFWAVRFSSCFFERMFRRVSIRSIPQGRIHLLFFCLCLITVAILLDERGASVSMDVFDLSSARGSYRDVPWFVSYPVSICSKVLLPFVAVVFLHKRAYLWFAICGLFALFFFFYTSIKSNCLYFLVSVTCYRLYSLRESVCLNFGWFLCGVIFLVVAASILASGRLSDYPTSLVIHRGFMIPSIVDFHYIEFFKTRDYIFWSDRFFTFGTGNYPYDNNIAEVISTDQMRLPSGSANAGLIGSGFSNFGRFGIVLYSLLLGLILSLINLFQARLPRAIAFASAAPWLIISFKNTDLLTAMLSHGGFLLLVVLLFCSRCNYNSSLSICQKN